VAAPPENFDGRSRAAAPPGHAIVLHDAASELRRSLRPVAWVVLEELALEAVVVRGALVAPTSARAIAERLRLDPATAASALRTLRERGLVELTRGPSPSGRFGLSAYRLGRLPGVDVLARRGDPPRVRTPHTVESQTGDVAPRGRRPRQRPSSVTQGALDLGLGTQ
jgi:DNA-binding transcriptional ArsR family regulator